MQTTYKGQTAGGILKTAQVAQTKAGTFEIFVTTADKQQAIAILGGRRDGWGGVAEDVLVLTEAAGCIARLSCSKRALQQLRSLTAKTESSEWISR